MKINEDCIRDILIYLTDNLKVEVEVLENHAHFEKIYANTVIRALDAEYDKENVWYSLYNLAELGYIEGMDVNEIRKNNGHNFSSMHIFNVSFRGHQFLETIRPETVWEQTKNIVSRVGVHTLGFIEDTAQKVAVESAKHLIDIGMGIQ